MTEEPEICGHEEDQINVIAYSFFVSMDRCPLPNALLSKYCTREKILFWISNASLYRGWSTQKFSSTGYSKSKVLPIQLAQDTAGFQKCGL